MIHSGHQFTKSYQNPHQVPTIVGDRSPKEIKQPQQRREFVNHTRCETQPAQLHSQNNLHQAAQLHETFKKMKKSANRIASVLGIERYKLDKRISHDTLPTSSPSPLRR